MEVGAATARAMRESPWRTALIASSSWSHAFLTDKHHQLYPDIEADRRLYEALRVGDYETWRKTPLASIEESGQQEMLNWYMLAGAMEELGRKQDQESFRRNLEAGRPEDLALICYTSGTTGQPKGAMLSFSNLLTMALSLHQVGISCRVYDAVPVLAPLGYGINLQPNAVRELIELGLLDRLELHSLSNPDAALRYALLTDFTDAPAETTPDDDAIVRALTDGVRALNDLPENARRYVSALERAAGVPIALISVGPERTQTIERAARPFRRGIARPPAVA